MVPSVEQEIRDLHELFGSSRDPEGRAFVPLADAYRRAGDPARALELLDEGLHRHPRLPAAHLVAALTRIDLFDLEGAQASFRLVLEADPDNARALVGLGHLLASQGDDDGEGDELVRRGLALDPDLEGESVAPRAGGVAEAASEAPSVAEVASLLEWDLPPAVDEGPGPVDAPDGPLPPPDEATPPEAAAGGGEGDAVMDPSDLAPTDALAVDELDIEWESEGFYGIGDSGEGGGTEEEEDPAAPGDFVAIGDLAALEHEPLAGDPVGETASPGPDSPDAAEVILDAALLAPDDWEGGDGATGPGVLPTGDVDADDLLMELADLAPDIEPGSRPEDEEPPDEVLPTRTLGELYARQGLIGEAVKVFEELARHAPSDSDLQVRLAELRAEAAPTVDHSRHDDAETGEPSITDFLEGLLGWEPTPRDDGTGAG